MNKYITTQGDMWDTISLKCYGNERYMHKLIEANYIYRDIIIFPANIELRIPELEQKKSDLRPIWRK